jgi:hypothetical protein
LDFFIGLPMGGRGNIPFFSLKDGDNWVSGNAELVNMVTDYYKSLFGPAVGNVFEADSNLWKGDERVTNMENQELTKPFLEEEIKLALFQMEKKQSCSS